MLDGSTPLMAPLQLTVPTCCAYYLLTGSLREEFVEDDANISYKIDLRNGLIS
jgi:hypothetical protein